MHRGLSSMGGGNPPTMETCPSPFGGNCTSSGISRSRGGIEDLMLMLEKLFFRIKKVLCVCTSVQAIADFKRSYKYFYLYIFLSQNVNSFQQLIQILVLINSLEEKLKIVHFQVSGTYSC